MHFSKEIMAKVEARKARTEEEARKDEEAKAAEAVKQEEEKKVDAEKPEKDFSSLGKVWEKGGRRRLYLVPAKVAKAIGMDVECYNSGSVRSASFRGEAMSNNAAWKVLTSWDGAYIDMMDGTLHGSSVISVKYEDEILEAYRAL